MELIKTKFFNDVDKNCPLNDYPRPQLQRDNWQNLNGVFQYAIGMTLDKIPDEFNNNILVPFAYESQLSGVCKQLKPSEILWYRKTFSVNDNIKNDRILLHFGAVDWKCKVYINETFVFEHIGGYIPFDIDITDQLTDGENVLHVAVYDPTDEGWQQRGKQALESHGFWYTGTSGIWQTVWLEGVSKTYIEKVKLLPDIDYDCLKVNAKLNGSADKIVAQIIDGDQVLVEKEIQSDDSIAFEEYDLWSPENPKLYDIRITVYENDKAVDTVLSYFGMRKHSIRVVDGLPRLCLNNEPYFHNGLLDQGYWCDGGMTPPTDEAMIYDIAKMKELGFNMLRKHIKVEPARWYYHCDRLGMLVWQDMISGGRPISKLLAGVLPNINVRHVKDDKYKAFSREKPEWRENFRTELFEMIDSLYNSVSVCCWVTFNEGWGQFDAYEIGHAVKKYDPSRFVDHASGWHDQHGPEFNSIHRYIVSVTLPLRDGRPFVLSEFGGYSRIIKKHVWNQKKSFGYIMYPNEKLLSAAYKLLFKTQIIPLIKHGLCATVYTQVSDVEFEVNGILTYDRKIVKLDENMLKEINAQMHY